MKLFLASEAKNPQSIPELEKFVGGFNGKSIAYIPTAANGHGWGSWKEGGSWKLVQTLGMNISLIELENYYAEDVVPQLMGKDIIWFAGGSVGYLAYWLMITRLTERLPDVLNKGSVYVGSSAGSMVASSTLHVAEWYIGENENGVSRLPGLNLVNFEIYPHYQDELFNEIKNKYTGKKLYLLKDGEEVIVDGDTIRLIGEERIVGTE